MLPTCMQASFNEHHHTASEHALRDPGLSMSPRDPRLYRAEHTQRSAPELPLQTVRDLARNRIASEDPTPKTDLCRHFEWTTPALDHHERDRVPSAALPLRTWDGLADRNVRRDGAHNLKHRRRRSSSCSALPRSSDFHRNPTTPPHNLEEPAVSSPPRRTPAARGRGVSSSHSPKKKEKKDSKVKERSMSPDKAQKKRADRSESPSKANREKERIQKIEEAASSKAPESPAKKPDSPKQKRKSHKSPGKARAVREGARHQISQAESSDVITEIKRLRERCERFLEDIAKEPQKLVKTDCYMKVPGTFPAEINLSPPPRWIQSKDFSYEHLSQEDLECTKTVAQTTGARMPPLNLFSESGAADATAPQAKSSTSFVDQATSPLNMQQLNMMSSPAWHASPAPESLPSTKKVHSPQSPGTPLSPGSQHFIGWAQAAQRLCAAGPYGPSSITSIKAGTSSNQKAMDDLDAQICALLGSKN